MTDGASQFLAATVRELRLERGWSARELSERCVLLGGDSLTRSAIAKIECGRRGVVTFDEAVTFARVLGVPLADLAPPAPEHPERPAGLAPPAPEHPDLCASCGVTPYDTRLHAQWHEKIGRLVP